MSLKQRKNTFLKRNNKLPALGANRSLVLKMQESISEAIVSLKMISKFVVTVLIVAFVAYILFIVAPAAFQELTVQLIRTYQHSFIDSNTNSKDSLPVAASLVVGVLSLIVGFGVALLNINQNRDYSLKKKDVIYTVYDKIWQLLANTRYFSRPYMSSKEAVTLYDDFTCKIMGAGTYKLKKKWLSMEQVFEKFFSSQETLDDIEKNNFYDCIALMEKQISGFTSSSLRKTIIEKFLK